MDLASIFSFDDATLEFCNAMNSDDPGSTTDASNLTSPFDLLSSPEHTNLSLSPVSHHGGGYTSEDSGMDNLHYLTDGSTMLSSADECSVQPMTLLSAPSDTTFKYILDASINNASSMSIGTTNDGGNSNIITLQAAAIPTITPITDENAVDCTTVEAILKNEPLLNIAANLTTQDLAAHQTQVPQQSVSIECDKANYSAKSSNGKVELKIISQPARNHRARYRTEGSRGAVKDRSGRSFPIVKLSGYNRTPVKLRCYIGHDKRHGEPHLFYQVSKIIGKNVTPCQVTKIEGIKVIEIELTPSANMQAVINCVGIVKERNFDVQRKATNLKKKHLYNEDENSNKSTASDKSSSSKHGKSSNGGIERRSTACTLVFGCQIPGTNEILQVVSDPINCAQLLGCPEVHKISATRADIKGGDEVFIIGKNFTRDTKLMFECPQGNWAENVDPEPEYVNQNHLIIKIPAYTGTIDKNTTDATGQIDVTFKIMCGDKHSEPYLFSYTTASQPIEFSTWILK